MAFPPDNGATLRRRRSISFKHLAASASALLVPGCSKGVLDPAGPIGAGEKLILLNSLAIMLAIVIPTIVVTLVFAWWYRAGNTKATYRPEFAYSGRIELLVWSIPILTIIFLGGVTWIGSHRLDPFKPLPATAQGGPIEVQVVSLDWKWLFIYPASGVASVNKLVVPAGRPVHFSLTSASVMNSFFVPQLGSQIYTMNGMVTQLSLQADKPGSYFGQSTHFSGDGFSDMYFTMDAVSPQQFAGWIARAHATGPLLDGRGYAALSKQSTKVTPFTYRAVAPSLFNAVATQRLAPAAGPQEGRGGPQVSPGDNS